MRLTKKDKAFLGRKYAEALFWHRIESPAELPALKCRKDWQAADAYEKKQVMAEIATFARDELLKAGHNRETVLELVNKYIRHR